MFPATEVFICINHRLQVRWSNQEIGGWQDVVNPLESFCR